jgi:hypothetical protein
VKVPAPEGAWQDSDEGIDWALRNHPPETPVVHELLDELTEKHIALALYMLRHVPRCPERSLAMNQARKSLQMAKAAVCCHQDEVVP